MDLGKKKKFGLERIGEDPLSYQQAGAPVDWEFGLVAGNSSVSMVDTFCSTLWNNGSRSISTSNAVAIAKPISGTDMNWSSSSSISRGGLVPQTGPGMPAMCLPNFQVDSAFIERAARFSCFNGTDFSGVVHCFGASGPSNSHQNALQGASGAPEDPHGEPKLVDHGSIKESNGLSCNSQEEKQSSGDGIEDSSSKELGSKKRKRTNQEDLEMEQVEGGPQLSAENAKEGVDKKQKAEQETSTMAAAKSSGKQAKDSSNTLKEDFVHVRARRGQATNSHSLAERVRREKISERMKLLQNLVPGCSKVTGKAVMLDEIINYVQSLQRQVEFLSMKLAAVNPRLDFNIEGLLSKDLLQSTNGFTSDVIHPLFHPSQQGFFQAAVPPGMVNPPDALRRAASAQLTTMNPYKESSSQMANAWDEELQNVVQMTFGMNPSISNQELNGKPHNGFPI